MNGLQNRIIALTEARRGRELATLVEKLGGVAYWAPAVREVPCADPQPAIRAIDRISRGDIAVTIFLTGVGTRALLALADAHGRRAALLAGLASALVIARGPKTIAALREAGVRVDIAPSMPTSEGVLEALRVRDVRGARIAVQRYGDDNTVLGDGLIALGAHVVEVPLYEWALPESLDALERLVRDVIAGAIDAIAFTSSPQIHHAVHVADRLGLRAPFLDALRGSVVGAVGPVCSQTLAGYGVANPIEPDRPTMGALLHAIASAFAFADREAARA